jgi:hypothetical protein
MGAISRPRAAGLAGACLAFGLAACTEIFGFEPPVLERCLLASDCADGQICRTNVCTPECRSAVDCDPGDFGNRTACIDGLCEVPTMVSALDSGADAQMADVSIDSKPTDATAETEPTDAPRDAEPTDGGNVITMDSGEIACGCSCPLGDCSEAGPECFQSWYTPVGKVQNPGPIEQYTGISAGELAGQRISVTNPGCLVRMGFFVSPGQDLAQSTPTEYVIGLYDQGAQDEYPNKEIWRSPVTAIKSRIEQNEVAVTPPVPLKAGLYWIVGSWSNVVALDKYPSTGDWVEIDSASFDAGWPDPFPAPAPDQPPSYANQPQAIEYAVVVSPP